MTAKQTRLIGTPDGIAVELLGCNAQAFLLARLPQARVERGRVIIGGSDALVKARWAFSALKRRGYDITVDDSLRIDQLIASVRHTTHGGTVTKKQVTDLIDCMKFRWLGLDTKLEIGQLLANLFAHNERGGGLNGFRIVEISAYTSMIDNTESKNSQIQQLLAENEDLRIQLAHRSIEIPSEICG